MYHLLFFTIRGSRVSSDSDCFGGGGRMQGPRTLCHSLAAVAPHSICVSRLIVYCTTRRSQIRRPVYFTDSMTKPFHNSSPAPWQQRSPSLSRRVAVTRPSICVSRFTFYCWSSFCSLFAVHYHYSFLGFSGISLCWPLVAVTRHSNCVSWLVIHRWSSFCSFFPVYYTYCR